MVVENLLDLIGKTPILHFEGLYLKLEGFNLGGSIKDRVGLNIIETYIKEGKLKSGDTIIEATSGNTGIGLACVASTYGINTVIVMPDSMTSERINSIKAYGAEVILTKGQMGMKGAIDEANRLVQEKGYLMIDQFNNPLNPLSHKTTALEILEDIPDCDIVVCGIGTGGTISGIGRFIKEINPAVQMIGYEPYESAVLNGKEKGTHQIQGIGAGFIPTIYEANVVDKVEMIKSEDALAEMNRLRKKGLFIGVSGAGAILAAKKLDSKKKICVVIPDSGSKYLSLIK